MESGLGDLFAGHQSLMADYERMASLAGEGKFDAAIDFVASIGKRPPSEHYRFFYGFRDSKINEARRDRFFQAFKKDYEHYLSAKQGIAAAVGISRGSASGPAGNDIPKRAAWIEGEIKKLEIAIRFIQLIPEEYLRKDSLAYESFKTLLELREASIYHRAMLMQFNEELEGLVKN